MEEDIFDRILSLPGLRIFKPFYQAHREVLLYLFFGAVTTAVSLFTYWAATEVFRMEVLLGNIISWILAVLVAFLTNRVWVFRSHTEGARAFLAQAVTFYGGRVSTLVMEEIILFVGIDVLGLPNMWIKLAAQVLVMILNYVISKLFIFREKNK